MSIILKGIDLPEKYQNILIERKDGKVFVEWLDEEGIFHISEAIQIPKDHGRLIDADALETVFKDMAKCEWNQNASPISWAYAFEDTIEEIQDAPTILEAEEENEI